MTAQVCVIGVGYVGTKLVEVFSKKFTVVGYDVSLKSLAKTRVNFKSNPNVELTSKPNALIGAQIYLVAVPTLLNQDKSIDSSFVESAVETILQYASPGSGIVVESSVSVGMTRELLSFASSDYHIGFSPERVDPGRDSPVQSIPKIISGLNETALEFIHSFYSQVFEKVVPVSSIETAEFCKLYENCFRMINIAYVQEITDACLEKDVDPYEVIRASATKPFGFMPFYPSLGVGGHCIPVNPHYLFVNNDLPVLKMATELASSRPAQKALKFCSLYQNALRVIVVGIGFKPGQGVTSFSPGLAFAQKLKSINRQVSLFDPLIEGSNMDCDGFKLVSESEWMDHESVCEQYDAIFVAMRQQSVNWSILGKVTIPVVFGDLF